MSERLGAALGLTLALSLTPACDNPPPSAESRVLPYTQSGVPWLFDSEGRAYLVDTGSPRSFVVPELAGRPADSFALTSIEGWSVRGLGTDTEVVVTRDLPPAILPMIGANFGGILGADILADQPFLLDARRGRLILDDDGDFGEWMREVDGVDEVPVEVRGGGVSCMAPDRCFEHAGLRMLVELEIEGEPVTALVDTASTFTTMGAGLRLRLTEARPELRVDRAWDEWRFTRIHRMRVGKFVVDEVPVRVNPELDAALARLSVEVNQPVEMLLGHSVLLHFAAGFDYGRGTLTLGRHAELQPLETEFFESHGLWLADSVETRGCFVITALARDPETEAAQLEIGDCVTAVREVSAKELSFVELERVLALEALGEALEVELQPRRGPEDSGYVGPKRRVSLTKRDLLPTTQTSENNP